MTADRGHGMTRAELAAWVARSRAAQGLPPKITDPAMLARLVTLAFAGLDSPNTTTPRGRSAPRRRIDRSAEQQARVPQLVVTRPREFGG